MRTSMVHRLFCRSERKYQVSYIWSRAEFVVKTGDGDIKPGWVSAEHMSSAHRRCKAFKKKIVGEGAKIRRKDTQKRHT